MDKLAHMVGEKVGDMVEDAVKNALGLGDKDKDKKKDKGGGILSLFGGDKDKEKKDKGKKDEEKGGFFSHFLDKDDDKDEKGKQKKSGFAGLFSEEEGAGAVGRNEGETAGGSEGSGGHAGQVVGVNDGDLLNDLIEVAEENSKGK